MTLEQKQRIRERYRKAVHPLPRAKDEPRVAVYIRTAAPSIDQAASDELLTCEYREYGRKRGWNLVAFYTDQGQEHSALDKLKDDCRDGEIDLVATRTVRTIRQDLNKVMETITAFAARSVDVYFMAEGILMEAER